MKPSTALAIITAALPCILLAACANATYTGPSSGPTAQFTIPGKTNAAVGIMQDSSQCQKRVWLSGDGYSMYSKDTTVRTIPADTLVTLYVHSISNIRDCEAVISFKPQANQAYSFIPTWEQASLIKSVTKYEVGHCTYTIMNTNTRQPVGLMVRNYEKPVVGKRYCADALAQGQGKMAEVTTAVAEMQYTQ